MIRIAAVGDVHYDRSCRNRLRDYFAELGERADALFLAGDLTQKGFPDEAEALAYDLSAAKVPVIGVLGNHDYHSGHEERIRAVLASSGVVILEGRSWVLEVRGMRVGIVGLKGFGGGFAGACITEFGEREVKDFARYGKEQAEILQHALSQLDTDFRFVILHYSPVEGTLLGERREIYPFLGSYLLGEAIDAVGADGVFHGHAHSGTERGNTRMGVPVRNVAQPVIRRAYNIYTFERPVS